MDNSTPFALPPEVLQLPEFILPEKRPRRPPGPVDFDILKDQQRAAAHEIIEYLTGNSEHRMFRLRGYAGTGKSFLVTMLVEYMLYALKMEVAVTAPTNKAVQILKDMSTIESKSLTYATIHTLLGLKPMTNNDDGTQFFAIDTINPPTIGQYHIIIVDETSMLDDSLFNHLERYQKKEKYKLLFVGDPAQIPPVGRVDCIPFVPKKAKEFGIGGCDLTDILRQARENPILRLASAVREQRMQKEIDYDYQTELNGDTGMIVIPKKERQAIYEILRIYFDTPYFQQYPDFMKVVAWRNSMVDAVNKVAREIIYKQPNLPKLMNEEKLIVDRPHKISKSLTLTANMEVEVVDYHIEEDYVPVYVDGNLVFNDKLKWYLTRVRFRYNGFIVTHEVRIIHEDDEKHFYSRIDELVAYALKMPSFKRGAGWRARFAYEDQFLAVKYNYAITAHKAQGSTYENCMVIDWDINTNQRSVERNRIMYVALTRARKRLFLIQDI